MSNPVQDTVGPLPKGTIFLVDDDETDCLLFRRAVADAQLPYECCVFTSGGDLLDALLAVLRGAEPPVACFLDVKMPDMSGLDVLRWIRAQSALRPIPVVMISSSDNPQFVSEAMQLGAQCYVSKFPTAQQLREIMAAAERHAATASCCTAFVVSCNLLMGSRVAV